MRETDKRIQLYRARLPKVRKKLTAALLLFAISAMTMTVATFSWISLSVAPEVSGVATNIVANGNLEIALVNIDGSLPSSSKVGDSLLNIIERNRTWGNLINLSDASYGLDKIVLRPALLAATRLDSEPLSAAKYTADGRVEKNLDTKFNYAVYDTTTGIFKQSDDKGIRAISSVVYENIEYKNPSAAEYASKINAATASIDTIREAFNGLSGQMDSIAGLIATYMNGILRDTGDEEPCKPEDIYNFYLLLCSMDDKVMEPLGQVFIDLFAIYQDQTDKLAATNEAYTPVKFNNIDEFCAGAKAELKKMNDVRKEANKPQIVFSSLDQYISDRKKLKADIETLRPDAESYESGVPVSRNWSYVKNIANNMVNIAKVTLNGKTMTQWFSNISISTIPTLLGVLGAKASENDVVIHEGMLERLDKLLHNGIGFYVESITITFDKEALKAKADSYISGGGSMVSGVNNNVSANISTDAVHELPTSTTTADLNEINTLSDTAISSKEATAKETYGLALDFWLRTNKTGSYLLLEGDVTSIEELVFETVQYPVFDSNGNVTETVTIEDAPIYITDIIYTTQIDYADPEAQDEIREHTRENQEIFKVEKNGTVNWYFKNSGDLITLGTTEPTNTETGDTIIETVSFSEDDPEQKTNTVITGYSGVNRVWQEDKIANADISTTQGSGSCYIFYADTPEEMDQSLEVISAMRVAFIDAENGTLLAEASFDTTKKVSEYGRVIVPMYLINKGDNVVSKTNDNGSKTDLTYITLMENNVPKMITAIVYLDGSKVTNDKVLSSSEIEGSLNIQFGSYTVPEAMDDEKLMASTRTLTAELMGTYDYALGDGKEHVVDVRVNVSGDTPTSITGNFIRKISQTQGTRQESFAFENKGDGTWEGSFEFATPGEFILRTITVDGIEYALNQTTFPTVIIDGFGLDSVSGINGVRWVYRTAENYVTEKFTVKVAGLDGAWPQNVQGVFVGDNNTAVTAHFGGGPENWEANVTFTKSGTYTLSHIIIDGQHFPIASPIIREVYTGLYSRVSIELADTYDEGEAAGGNPVVPGGIRYFYIGNTHEFKVSVEIFDNSGKKIEALQNVKLEYTNGLDADLRWNQEDECYDGESFLVETPGSYNFYYVSIPGGEITKTIGAPSITAATKDPVKYLGIRDEMDTYIVKLGALPSETAQEITLVFENAKSATVYGLFERQTKTAEGNVAIEYRVLAALNNDDNTHTFSVPSIEGNWKLLDVKAMNVYDKATETFYVGNPEATWPATGNSAQTLWYDLDDVETNDGIEDYYYNVDISDVADLTYTNLAQKTKIITSIKVSDMSSQSKEFNGVFMQEHTVSGLSVSFTDFNGEKLKEEATVSNVYMDFEHTKDSKDKGGYTMESSVENLNLSFTGDGMAYQSDAVGFTYAGTYTGTLWYTVEGYANKFSASGINVVVRSTVPTVKITAISPTGTYSYDNSNSKVEDSYSWPNFKLSSNHKPSGATSSFDKVNGKSAKVYFKCTHSDEASWKSYVYLDGLRYHNYVAPTVTISLTNMGNATKATLAFTDSDGNAANIYKGISDNTTITQTGYEWDSTSTSCVRYIGYWRGGTGVDTKTPAGTITAKELVMTYGGVDYTFDIEDITIENPY